ncbi:MAG TPA: amino acid adenylation domain-containing protein [Blastocatellia bacterium]|jgi:amino acid adenylation domain-containing protein|nr:amino acid adenylation domain-containing protein [Blastocatellia bacterium]
MKSLNPQNSSRDLNIKVSVAATATSLDAAAPRWPQDERGIPAPEVQREISESSNADSIGDSYPLSPMQQGMLFHSLYARNPGVNIEQVIYSLHEDLNAPAFMRAWQQVVNRHAILRSSFRWEGVDEPLQEVHSRVSLEWRREDLSGSPEGEREARVEAYLREDRLRGFDLKEESLMRMALFRTGKADFEFIWTFHHAIVDGRSLVIILNEVFAYYEAFRKGQTLNLAPPVPYRKYIDWLRRQDSSKAEEFWRRTLDGFASPTPLVIAGELDGGPDREPQYEEQEISLDAGLTSALRVLARENEITFNTLVQGAWALLLSRYGGQEDVVFGAARRCRRSSVSDADSIVGLFINTLPMRVIVRDDMRLLSWLKDVRAQHVTFREYEHTPLAKIQEWSQVPNGTALFDSILIFENYELNSYLQSQGSDWADRDFEIREQPTYPLELSAWAGEELLLRMAYDAVRFDVGAISRMLGHLKTLLAAMVENPDVALSSLAMLTEQERRQLAVEWNDTRKPRTAGACVHHLFESQAGREPGAVALLSENGRLSYGQLNERANQLAHHLRSLGVGPGVLVAICLDRSPDLIVGLLATLKAGGAYVPLDPAYPKERLAMMLADARPAVVLAHGRTVNNLPPCSVPIVCLDSERSRIEGRSKDNPRVSMAARDLAYVIYTSGSTGNPKGVMVEHRSVVNYVNFAATEFDIKPGDRVLQFASISFDTSAEEIYPCLTRGATLVLRDDSVLASTSALLDQCAARGITVLDLPTAYWHELTARACAEGMRLPRSLRLVIIGGESVLPERLAMWRRHVGSSVRLVNTYGPTEATIVATTCDLTPGRGKRPTLSEATSRKAPIGRPIDNVQVYVLDRRHRLSPVGVPGELHVGGEALARGYVNRPGLTAEKFTPNPFSDDGGSRLYKTGDLARYLPDGNIQFCGRVDNQVKVHGFRIELGDVEATLARSPVVASVAVSVREGAAGDKQLVAYVVPTAGGASVNHAAVSAQLKSFLEGKLPRYMIPSAFVTVDALPLNKSGKLDRKSLPEPRQAQRNNSAAYVRPRDPLEYHLVQIWEELFDSRPIGITDNFFSLGGHSLLSIRMMDRIEQAFGLRLPLATLFATATIEYLAEALLKQGSESGRSPIVAVQPNGERRPFYYLHGDFNGGGLYCLNLARHLGPDQPFYALQPHGIDGDRIPPTIEAMAKDHVETLRAFQPEGPYFLGGHCNGGLVAFEMAQQLKAQGQEVGLLAIICATGTNARFRALHRLVSGYCSLRGFGIDERQRRFLRCLDLLELLKERYGARMDELSGLNLRDRLTVIGKNTPKAIRKVGNLILGRAAPPPGAHSAGAPAEGTSIAENRRQSVMNAYVKAMTAYVPAPYRGPISLLWPAESPFEPSEDPTWGWGDVAAQVDVRIVPGGHLTCIIDHAKDLAAHLRECLRKAQAGAYR